MIHRLTSEEQRRRTGDALTRLQTRFRGRDPIPDSLSAALVPEAERQVRGA